MKSDDLREGLIDTLTASIDGEVGVCNVVDGLFAIAGGLQAVARSLDRLGNGDAATPMGAIEFLGKNLTEKLDFIAVSIGSGLTEIADAIEIVGTTSTTPSEGESIQ